MKKDSNVVSVIIPTIGRSSLTDTRKALKKQTRLPDEVLVIEDSERRGPSWARNEGVKKAKGNLIVFTDDDCIPEKDWLDHFIKSIEEHNASMVSSGFVESDTFLHEIKQRRKFPTSVQINPKGFVGNSGNVIYRRECLEECLQHDGYIYNPVFGVYAAEDTDLACRLRRRGHKLVFINNEVTHLKNMTPMKYLKYQFNRGIGIGILYKLHKKTNWNDLPSRSLLWDQNAKRHPALKWMVILCKKILGPFDYWNFTRFKRFIIFWAGEKVQSFGFLFCLLIKKVKL